MLKAPKILPWIARKAGISDELALKLWRRAISDLPHVILGNLVETGDGLVGPQEPIGKPSGAGVGPA